MGASDKAEPPAGVLQSVKISWENHAAAQSTPDAGGWVPTSQRTDSQRAVQRP